MTESEKQQVAARLRASRKQGQERRNQEGAEAGEYWARELAETAGLEALAAFDADLEGAWADHLAEVPIDELGSALFCILHPDVPEDRDEVAEFWQETLADEGQRVNNRDYAAGFVAGALAVWREVEEDVTTTDAPGG